MNQVIALGAMVLCLGGCRARQPAVEPEDGGTPVAWAGLVLRDAGEAAAIAEALRGEPRPIDVGPGPSSDPRFIAAEPIVMGGLDKEAVVKVLRGRQAQLRACYAAQLDRLPALEGDLLVKLIVGPAGQVTSAHLSKGTLSNPELEACVLGAARTWAFSPVVDGGIAIVASPLHFKK